MKSLAEKTGRIPVQKILGRDEAWGRPLGREIFKKLDDALFEMPADVLLITLDFRGLKRTDASFPQEAIVELMRKYRGQKYFSLTGFEDESVEENFDLAFFKRGETGIVRNHDGSNFHLIGVVLPEDQKLILQAVEAAGSITSSEVVNSVKKIKAVSLANAANKLKNLWGRGLLIRVQGAPESGGREHTYHRVS